MDEQEINKLIDERIANFLTVRGFVFSKPIQILDGRDVQTGRGTGTMIATAGDQKLGFFGTTPIAQPTLPGSPVLSDVVTLIKNLGLSK